MEPSEQILIISVKSWTGRPDNTHHPNSISPFIALLRQWSCLIFELDCFSFWEACKTVVGASVSMLCWSYANDINAKYFARLVPSLCSKNSASKGWKVRESQDNVLCEFASLFVFWLWLVLVTISESISILKLSSSLPHLKYNNQPVIL